MATRNHQKHADDLLVRGVTSVVPHDIAEAKIRSGKPLRVYFGIDPTGDKLHLGHAVALRKLRDFQRAGHHCILLIGSFTAMIGDPSGRELARTALTAEQVKKNFATYKAQASKVLDLSAIAIEFNHTWLGKLHFAEVMALAQHFTVQQLMERDMFQERQRKGHAVGLHELFYPLMVGYDSVMLDVDVEIGGNDQLFNMLCGRALQHDLGKRDKFVVTTKLLEGTDGRKMSKTYGNCIYLTDEPNDMFGKVMSIKDELIVPYLEAATDLPMEEIAAIQGALLRRENPKGAKLRLAREIVALYHGTTAATEAEAEFERVHKSGALPADLPTAKIPAGKKVLPIVEVLMLTKLAQSKSEARRLVEQGGVRVNGEQKTDWKTQLQVAAGMVIQVGSRKFCRLR